MSNTINILSHPLVDAELTKLRHASTSSKEFREGIRNLSWYLGYEASRNLEQETMKGTTPVGPFEGKIIKPRIGLTPVLRAGLGMTDALLDIFPAAPVYHLGIYREKVSLQPVEYYSKLPASAPVDQIFVLDPLIATGATACAALQMIVDWKIPAHKIKLLAVLASDQGLKHVQSAFPEVEIWLAGVDDTLTAQGIISPGLGDTGDRLYNTLTNQRT